ncbi:nitronate monooxygenase family protein [Nocardia sp. 852002-20019_SCH5090214]|uniref:NAD(P)H-dependent flavin oxidoreductase n=1 Tax=Nocardia sp. 852002-20019_SCH5090214 TaxID=1834087 RepID=UPI0009EE66D9|nr:nitronate monooxygenase [Nocardia sp. 852002-20019_SCH5090214]
MALPDSLTNRLTIPAIAAPMTSVSGPDLVIAACRHGVVGSFPTHNAATTEELDGWLEQITSAVGDHSGTAAPIAPNLVVHRTNARLQADLDCLVRHGVELVITSVGSPKPVIAPLHDIGCQVLADVSSMAHVERALEAGADGLVLLTAGAGGQTGWANPFAFTRAVRAHFDGPIVLAGGITDGTSILAAQALGVDLVYLGTRFIATTESLAEDGYRAALVESTLDDVTLSTYVGGIPASLLASWLAREGASELESHDSNGFEQDRLLRNRTAWSAGHSVAGVDAITSAAELIGTIAEQYDRARTTLLSTLTAPRSHSHTRPHPRWPSA